MSGSGEVRSVKIAPEAVDRDDVETLEDLIVAALHAAAEEQRKLTERKLGPLAGGLPGLGGLSRWLHRHYSPRSDGKVFLDENEMR